MRVHLYLHAIIYVMLAVQRGPDSIPLGRQALIDDYVFVYVQYVQPLTHLV